MEELIGAMPDEMKEVAKAYMPKDLLSPSLRLKGWLNGAPVLISATSVACDYTGYDVVSDTLVLHTDKVAGPPVLLKASENPLVKRWFDTDTSQDFLKCIDRYTKELLDEQEKAQKQKEAQAVKAKTSKSPDQNLTDVWLTALRSMEMLRAAGYEKAVNAFPKDYDGKVHDDGTNRIIAAKLEEGVLQLRFPK